MNINSTSVNVKRGIFHSKAEKKELNRTQKKKAVCVCKCTIRMRALDAKIRRREWEKPIKIKIFMYSRGGL